MTVLFCFAVDVVSNSCSVAIMNLSIKTNQNPYCYIPTHTHSIRLTVVIIWWQVCMTILPFLCGIMGLLDLYVLETSMVTSELVLALYSHIRVISSGPVNHFAKTNRGCKPREVNLDWMPTKNVPNWAAQLIKPALLIPVVHYAIEVHKFTNTYLDYFFVNLLMVILWYLTRR